MARTTGTISGDMRKYGKDRPLTRAQEWAIAGSALVLVLSGVVGLGELKQRLDAQQADFVSRLRQNSRTIPECMQAAGQDLCVRAHPERVKLDCQEKAVEVKQTDLEVGIGYGYGFNSLRFGPGVKTVDKNVSVTRLVC